MIDGNDNGTPFSRARFDANGNGHVKNIQFQIFPEGNYQVLDTDYTGYSVVYGCDNHLFGLFHNESAWVLQRWRKDKNQAVLNARAGNVLKRKVPNYNWE